MYIYTCYTRSNTKRCASARAKGIYHKGLAYKTEDVVLDIQKYWPMRHELAMIDGVAIKGKHVIIPSQLQTQILRQLHSSHMGIEKMGLLAHKSVYWVNMNADIENAVKQFHLSIEYQNTKPQEKTTPYEVLSKPSEVGSADIFMINNDVLLCIADYYSRFLVIKVLKSLLAEDLIQVTKVSFSELANPDNWCQMQA